MPPPSVHIPALDLTPVKNIKLSSTPSSASNTLLASTSCASSPSSVASTTSLRKLPFSYNRHQMLGKGAFSTVYFATNASTGEFMALKHLETARNSHTKSTANAMQKEIEVVSKLRHPHVVGYLGMTQDSDSIQIFMEYCPCGTLASFLNSFGPIPAPLMAIYTRQLLLGLTFLHHCGVAHRDIKGGNVLLAEKFGDVTTLKLSDFGSARELYTSPSPAKTRTLVPGTPLWSAPEVIRNECVTPEDWERADVWSLGEILQYSPMHTRADAHTS